MGACSALNRLGSTLTPLVGELLLNQNYFLPFLGFGISFILCGICCFFLKHDTINMALKDNIEDEKIEEEFIDFIESTTNKSNKRTNELLYMLLLDSMFYMCI